jgi:exonuclease VII large subunit
MNLNNFKLLIIICCIFALLFISIYSYYFEPSCYDVNTFSKLDVKKLDVVCINGNIRNLQINDGYLLLDLTKGSSKMKCILFNYNNNDLLILEDALLNNFIISVTGKIDFYNNALELIIYKFRVI